MIAHLDGEVAKAHKRLDEVMLEARDRLRYSYGTGERTAFRLSAVAEDFVPLPASAGPVPPARLVTGRRAAPDVAFGTIRLYEFARSGALDAPGLAEFPGGQLPPIGDPAAFEAGLCDARVRAAAED